MVSYQKPHFFRDGLDVPGALGDADSVENQFTVQINEPGGANATDYNFAVLGLETGYARTLDQLASRYVIMNPSIAYNGAYFGIASDNSLLWSAKLDGFDDAAFAEAVFSSDGREVLLTYVDGSQNVFTATLESGDFIRTQDANGNSLVRVLGSSADFNWQQINLATPPIVSASRYLDAVDAVFDQEEWR